MRIHWCPGFLSCLWSSSSAELPLKQFPQSELEMWTDDKELPPEKEKMQTMQHISSSASHKSGSKIYAQLPKSKSFIPRKVTKIRHLGA